MNKKQIIFLMISTLLVVIIPIIVYAFVNNLELIIVIPGIWTLLMFIMYNRYAVLLLKNKRMIELSDDRKQKNELLKKQELLKESKKFFLITFLWFILVTIFMGLVVYNTL